MEKWLSQFVNSVIRKIWMSDSLYVFEAKESIFDNTKMYYYKLLCVATKSEERRINAFGWKCPRHIRGVGQVPHGWELYKRIWMPLTLHWRRSLLFQWTELCGGKRSTKLIFVLRSLRRSRVRKKKDAWVTSKIQVNFRGTWRYWWLYIFKISSLFMFSRSGNPLLTFLLSYHVWVTSKIQVNFWFKIYSEVLMIINFF